MGFHHLEICVLGLKVNAVCLLKAYRNTSHYALIETIHLKCHNLATLSKPVYLDPCCFDISILIRICIWIKLPA